MLLCIIPQNFRLISEILKEFELQRPPSDLVKKPIMEIFSFVEGPKVLRTWPFLIAVCSMVLIAEILKELERGRRSGRTDGRTDEQTDIRTDGFRF